MPLMKNNFPILTFSSDFHLSKNVTFEFSRQKYSYLYVLASLAMLWNDPFSLIFKHCVAHKVIKKIPWNRTIEKQSSHIPKVSDRKKNLCKTWQINAKFNSDTSTRFLLSFWLFCVCQCSVFNWQYYAMLLGNNASCQCALLLDKPRLRVAVS